jgi:ABC-type nitrate/sulfonate/bicarbonate transport system permease component
MRRAIRGAILPGFILLAWEIAARTGVLTYESLSYPSAIAQAGFSALADGSILVSTWQTCQAALFGLLMGTAAGILLGSVLGLWTGVARMAGPSFDALRAIPAVALMPLALLMFGWGLSMEACTVAYACTWPVLIATWAAVRGIEPRLLEVADALEMGFGERLLKIVLPAAFARINVGIRIALGVALVVAVTVEIAVNPRGLGYSLVLAQQSMKADLMYAQIFWLALIGFVLNALLRTVETPGAAGRKA